MNKANNVAGINIENFTGGGIPGLMNASASLLDRYTVKYFKADLSDPSDLFQLSEIETKGIRDNDEIVLLTYDKYTFMDRYFVVVKYMEKNPS